MSDKKPEPNVYMDNTDSLMQALDNMQEMSPDEIRTYRKRIDQTRVAIPRKMKKKNEKDTDKTS